MMKHIMFTQKIFMKSRKNNKYIIKEFDLNYQVDPSINSTKFIKSSDDTEFTSHLYGDSIVKGNYADTLISVIFNTNNINNTKKIIEKFINNSIDSSNIQFCIKIDNDDQNFVDSVLENLSNFKANFIIIASPKGRGYIDLWQWINFLYHQSSKNSYFLLNISDEVHINTNRWDEKLEKYKKLFEDDIFRLRTSVYKNRNYNNIDECIYAPDTTAIYTRKYIATQGDFCPCFGPDNGQQIVAYYLAKLNYPRHTQFLRDYSINDINFDGEGTNIGLSEKATMKRVVINYLMWKWTHKYNIQLEYKKRARDLQVAIIKNLQNDIIIEHNNNTKSYKILIAGIYSGNTDTRESYIHLSYKVSKISCFIQRYLKVNYIKNHTGYDASFVAGFICHVSLFYLKKHPKESFLNLSELRSNNVGSLKGKKIIKFIYAFLTTPNTLVIKEINKFSSNLSSKEKYYFVFSLLLFILKIYELIINDILINTIREFFRFLLDKLTILRIFFNILLLYRKKEKINNSCYYELRSVVLINKKTDESQSLVVKGD